MIRSLRQRHRIAAFFMVVGLPVLLLAALAVRPGGSNGNNLPPELRPALPGKTSDIHSIKRLGSLPVHVSLLVYDDQPPALLIVESGSIGHPDVLLYWTPDRTINPESPGLPSSARLVGALGKGKSFAYPLPAESVATDGNLLAYSLARQALVESIEWPSLRSVERETAP